MDSFVPPEEWQGKAEVFIGASEDIFYTLDEAHQPDLLGKDISSYRLRHFFYHKENNKWQCDEINAQDLEQYSNQSEKHIRIINPFSVKHNTMLFLMEASNFCNAATGTQSLFEFIGKQKLPFYQIPPWHMVFYEELGKAVEKSCGDNCALSQWLSKTMDSNIDIADCVQFLKDNKEELHKDLKNFGDCINKQYYNATNFSDTFSVN